MRNVLIVAVLTAAWYTGPAPGARGAAPDKPAKKAAGENEPKEKLVPLGTLAGVVESVGESTGDLTLQVTVRYLEPNPGAQAEYLRQQQQIIQRQQALMLTRNPAQRQQQLNQLYQAAMQLQRSGANLFTVKEVKRNVELRLAEDVKVRSVLPPEQFDDKGNVKKYTKEELKELKGPDPRLPGYKADRDSIEKGRAVLVRVARRAVAPAKKVKGQAKDKEAPADKEWAADNKPLVTLVLVGPEPVAK
jgi:hypothetical protein